MYEYAVKLLSEFIRLQSRLGTDPGCVEFQIVMSAIKIIVRANVVESPSLPFQVHSLHRNIPVSVENLEASLLLTLVSILVGP